MPLVYGHENHIFLVDGDGMSLYEVVQKAKPMPGRGATVQVAISPEEEPLLREFFTQVAQLCGRPIVP